MEEVSNHLIKSERKFIYYTHSLSPRVRYVKEAPHAHLLASLPSCVLCSLDTEVEVKSADSCELCCMVPRSPHLGNTSNIT